MVKDRARCQCHFDGIDVEAKHGTIIRFAK